MLVIAPAEQKLTAAANELKNLIETKIPNLRNKTRSCLLTGSKQD